MNTVGLSSCSVFLQICLAFLLRELAEIRGDDSSTSASASQTSTCSTSSSASIIVNEWCTCQCTVSTSNGRRPMGSCTWTATAVTNLECLAVRVQPWEMQKKVQLWTSENPPFLAFLNETQVLWRRSVMYIHETCVEAHVWQSDPTHTVVCGSRHSGPKEHHPERLFLASDIPAHSPLLGQHRMKCFSVPNDFQITGGKV